jgi:hypothetical protein
LGLWPPNVPKKFENLVSNSAPIILQTAIIYIHKTCLPKLRVSSPARVSGASASEKEKEIGAAVYFFFFFGFYKTAEAT